MIASNLSHVVQARCMLPFLMVAFIMCAVLYDTRRAVDGGCSRFRSSCWPSRGNFAFEDQQVDVPTIAEQMLAEQEAELAAQAASSDSITSYQHMCISTVAIIASISACLSSRL